MATKPTPHYTLVAPSADGTCCPCSALSDPCTCAGLVPIIRCRQRSALAEMIGFRAYTSLADPPNTYLVGTLSGASTGYQCDGKYLSTWSLSGQDTWDPVTGVLTQGCTLTITGDGAGVTVTGFHTSPHNVGRCGFAVTVAPTSYTSAGTGECCDDGVHTGQTTGTMSQPHTEQQALYRATDGLQWSDWSLLTTLPGCSALWELRSGTTDYDFSVRESEYQLEFPALTVTEQATDPITGEPLWSAPNVPLMTTRTLTAQVEVRVDINRRPWNGGSPWMLYRTDTFGPLTITGTQTLEGVVPNDRGYETIITNVRYRVVG